jgi:hypothetical protein
MERKPGGSYMSSQLSRDEQQELKHLEKQLDKQFNQPSVAIDDLDDPDPDCLAARQFGIFADLYDEAKRRDQRRCAVAERLVRKRGEELNKHGL